MSLLVTFNGANYIIPEPNEVGWGSNLDAYFVAIAAGCLQKTGGSFTLSAETDFGSSFGLKSLYYKSRATNVASTGAFRLANAETGIVWRNFLGSGDLPLTVNASNQLVFNGTPIAGGGILTASRAVVTDSSGNLAAATTTATEIGYVNGVTSAIQTQINTKAPSNSPTFTGTITTPLTASRAATIGSANELAVSTVTTTELAYVSGVTSAIQTQLDAKATDSLVVHLAGSETITGVKNFTANPTIGGITPQLTIASTDSAFYSNLILNNSVSRGSQFISIGTTNAGTYAGHTVDGSRGLNVLLFDAPFVAYTNYSGSYLSFGTNSVERLKITDSLITASLAFLVANGSVSNPGIAASADTGTGIQFLGSNHSLDLVSNGFSMATFANDVAKSSIIRGATGIGLTAATNIQLSGEVVLSTSSTGITLTDNSTNTVKLKATNSTTSYTLSLPTTAGTNGYILSTDGSGNTSWTPSSGSGTVNSGTAGRLSLYATSAAAVSDTYVQNSQNIVVAIAAQASRSAGLTYTIPNPGNAATTATFPLLELAQTFTAAQTFNDLRGTFGADIAAGSHKITGLANGTTSTDAAAFGQLKLLKYSISGTTTAFTTTSNTYQTSNLSAAFTPTSASSTIIIIAIGQLRSNATQTSDVLASLFQDTTDLAATTTGLSSSTVTGNNVVPAILMQQVASGSTSSRTYSVKVKNQDNSTTVGFGNSTNNQQMLILELA